MPRSSFRENPTKVHRFVAQWIICETCKHSISEFGHGQTDGQTDRQTDRQTLTTTVTLAVHAPRVNNGVSEESLLLYSFSGDEATVDATEMWTDALDRGGLWHVKDYLCIVLLFGGVVAVHWQIQTVEQGGS